MSEKKNLYSKLPILIISVGIIAIVFLIIQTFENQRIVEENQRIVEENQRIVEEKLREERKIKSIDIDKAISAAEEYCNMLKNKHRNIASIKYIDKSLLDYEIKFLYHVKYTNLSYKRAGIITAVKGFDGNFRITGLDFLN